MSLYLFKIVPESLVKEFKDLDFLIILSLFLRLLLLFLGHFQFLLLVNLYIKFHLLVIKLLDIARIRKLIEILELVDVACIWLEELVELLKVIVINMNEVGTLASISLGHGLPQYGSELHLIDWTEIEGCEHVFLKYVGMLLEHLDLIC